MKWITSAFLLCYPSTAETQLRRRSSDKRGGGQVRSIQVHKHITTLRAKMTFHCLVKKGEKCKTCQRQIKAFPDHQVGRQNRWKNSELIDKANIITRDPIHPLHKSFQLLPLGRRCKVSLAWKNIHKNTFTPINMSILNATA